MDQRPNIPKPKMKEEGCRIRIKNTKSGKEISFSGKCGKNELNLASGNINDALEGGD
ncbi:MAG: hypothetical protein KKF48_02400 [Nanoarchaeota archaeon]|nr:hypothetical protein [Nanoarchaeota archaeon]MBU1027871.1 hypothetical protein [Nanoarchaeota archaeon]